MSQYHPTTWRQGLTALVAAVVLLVTALVVAPAAQAALPLVDASERDGTVVTTRMTAAGATIAGNAATDRIEPVTFWYELDLRWTGGELRSFDGEVTLQGVGATHVRRYPVTLDADGDRFAKIRLPNRVTPGFYAVGIEYTAAVERPDGKLVLHHVEVDRAKKISVRRDVRFQGEITNPRATDGRPSRITGQFQWLRISGDGDLSWSPVRNTTVRLYRDPDGIFEDEREPVFVRTLTAGPGGNISTVVPAREGAWQLRYAGNDWTVPRYGVILQGRSGGGCGC
ncbi:hypothetical protein ACO229_21610 [Promicromonospora sp. MS192]|uniref:hypothetical protein n=1 Tax=Promicromonospora sp. MS192 TaxID=3412684 RepID=UPI003C2C36D8